MRQFWDIGFDVLFSDEVLRMIIEDVLLKEDCAQSLPDCSQPSIFSYSHCSEFFSVPTPTPSGLPFCVDVVFFSESIHALNKKYEK